MIKKYVILLLLGVFGCLSCAAGETGGLTLEDLLEWPAETVTGLERTLEESLFYFFPLSVTQTRIDSDLGDAAAMPLPRSVSVIGSKMLNESGAQTLPGILRLQEGVYLADESGAGLNARVDLRGFGGEAKQALVLFDGIRAVEPFDNSTVWHLYPKEYLERVEIEHGGGSTIYGEGAFSGVMRMKTKSPSEDRHLLTEGSWGAWDTEKYFTEASGTHQNIGYYIGSRYKTSDGYRENSDHESASVLTKVRMNPSENFGIENAFYFADNETGIPGPLSQAEADSDRRQQDPEGQAGDAFFDRLAQNNLTMRLLFEDLGVEFTNQFGYRLRNQDSAQSFGGFFAGTSINELETETLSDVLQGIWSVDYGFLEADVTGGVEWSRDDIHNPFNYQSIAFGSFVSERAVDRRMFGGFLHGDILFREDLAAEAGVRWDKIDWDIYDLRAPNLQRRKKAGAISPKAGLSWRPADAVCFYANYAEAFKAPDANALIFETPNLFAPNPDVDPQIAHHYEAGWRYAHPEHGSTRAAFFAIDTKKEILFNDITNLNENFDTRRWGIEWAAEAAVADGVSVFVNYTYTKAEFDNGPFDGNAVPLVPKHRWNAGVTCEPLQGWTVSSQASGVYDAFALNDMNNLFPMNDYWTLEGRIAYRHDDLEIYVRAENLLNESYGSFDTSNAVDTLNVNPAPECYVEAGFRYIL